MVSNCLSGNKLGLSTLQEHSEIKQHLNHRIHINQINSSSFENDSTSSHVLALYRRFGAEIEVIAHLRGVVLQGCVLGALVNFFRNLASYQVQDSL